MMNTSPRILVVTSEWPTATRPYDVPFLVEQVDWLMKFGLEVDVFHFRGNQNPLNYFRAWLRLNWELSLDDYDLIHAHFGQAGLVALPVSAPLVVTFHGSDLQGIVGARGKYTLRGWLLRLVSRFVARRATKVLIVSEHLSKYLPSGLTYEVLPCGVDTSLFKPLSRSECRTRLGLPMDKRLILFSGDPGNPVKRFGLAREAIKRLGREDVALVVMKDVWHSDVPLYLNSCELLLSASLHEGSPTLIKEAVACNVPVVAARGGDVEYLSTIPGCVLCGDSPAEIAQGIANALEDGRLSEGREAALHFEIRSISTRLLSIYQDALHRRAVVAQSVTAASS